MVRLKEYTLIDCYKSLVSPWPASETGDLEGCGPSQPLPADWTRFCDLENFLCREGCISEATLQRFQGANLFSRYRRMSIGTSLRSLPWRPAEICMAEVTITRTKAEHLTEDIGEMSAIWSPSQKVG